MKNLYIIIFVHLIFTQTSWLLAQETNFEKDKTVQTEQIKSIIKILNINQIDSDLIKENDTVIQALTKAIKDSIKPERIRRRLDSFIEKRYSAKMLSIALVIEKSMGPIDEFEFKKNVDPNNSLNFNTAEEFNIWRLKREQELKTNIKVVSQSDSTKIDTLIRN